MSSKKINSKFVKRWIQEIISDLYLLLDKINEAVELDTPKTKKKRDSYIKKEVKLNGMG